MLIVSGICRGLCRLVYNIIEVVNCPVPCTGSSSTTDAPELIFGGMKPCLPALACDPSCGAHDRRTEKCDDPKHVTGDKTGVWSALDSTEYVTPVIVFILLWYSRSAIWYLHEILLAIPVQRPDDPSRCPERLP